MTTFDRYLLGRFWHVFGIGFFAAVGLYVIFDGFTNVDAFQDRSGGASAVVVLGRMARFYSYQALVIFDMVGPILTVLSTMVVFALLHKNREIHPILSAGVPTFRLVVPMLIGATSVQGLLFINQEFVFPRLAAELLKPIGAVADDGQAVQSRTDFASHIAINGQKLLLADRKVENAEFILPAPEVASEITLIKADEAIFRQRHKDRPAGWQLKGASSPFDDLRLTAVGEKLVHPLDNPDDLFIVTDVSPEQLIDGAAAYRYQSTYSLVEQLRSSTFSVMSARTQALHLHERLTRPFANLLAVCLSVPLVLRRESFSLITNMAVCAGVMIALLALTQATTYLGRMNWVSQDLAIWLPIIISGGLVAWFADRVQT